MMQTYSLLCPSRGRADDLERLILSIAETAAHPERVEVLIYVDNDDPEQHAYTLKFKSLGLNPAVLALSNLDLLLGEPLKPPLIYNILAERAAGSVLLITNAAQVYIDPGWDLRLDTETAKYPDGIYCMWFNDDRYGEKICTFPIVSRKWVDTLGYLVSPLFEHFNGDLWIWQIASMIQRIHYIPDVLVEHRHHETGKSEADETTMRNLKGGRPDRDRAMFVRFERYRILDASVLRDVMDDPLN